MRTLSRYIFLELLGPTAIGFGFYTFIILMNQLFRLAEMIIRRSVPFGSVLQLLALSLPHIVVLTIPMALLFGILIAIGRLSADSEIIAMRSVGVSTTQIYRPVFYFSLAVFLMNLWVMNFLTPWGNVALEGLTQDIFTSAVEREIKPRVFYDEFPNRVIYVDDILADGTWKGVFIADSTRAGRQQIIIASTGRLVTGKQRGQIWVELEDAENHFLDPTRHDRYDLVRNETQRILLPDQYSQPKVITYSRSTRSMNLMELVEQRRRLLKDDPDGADLRITEVEFHKKLTIPFACLAFGIVALPLGITNRRGGKSSGFTLSIGVILVYYILLSNGEELARAGKVPALISMWMPNAIMIAVGIYLIRRANADVGKTKESRVWTKLQQILQVLHLQFKKRRSGRSGQSILSRLDIRFPNTLDRYILFEFLKIFTAIMVSVVVLQLVVDYSETAGHIAENQPGAPTVLSYYRYLALVYLDKTIPLSILMGTLVCFGLLSRNNEVTAAKSIGVSLYRIALPILAVAIVVSGVAYLFYEHVLPYSTDKVVELRSVIKGKEAPRRSFSASQRQWMFGKGRYLFNLLSYDANERTLSRVQVFEFDPVSFKLTRRIYAEEARFDGTGWVFVDGWVRSMGRDGEMSFTPFEVPVRLHYPERPEYFATDGKRSSQMTFAELSDHIRDLESSGYSADELKVQLYQKTAWPFVSLVMALIALRFSFRMGKRGALYGVGVALFVAFAYWAVYGIFTKFGEVGNLPALLSAWSANILFIIAAAYAFLHVET